MKLRHHEEQPLMLQIIKRRFPVKVWKPRSAFDTLIHTILSQNTNDQNSDRAMRELRRTYRISPSVLSKAKVRDLMRCIRSAGLYRSKAPRIIEVSRIIQEQYGGSLYPILNLPYDRAKDRLVALPGVGPKTADILLAFVAGHAVIPIDTHIERVSKRLGIVPLNADYETIRTNLETLIAPRERLGMHLSLIALGREICRAPRPHCLQCPVNELCPSSTT